jgi:hypothetical protein
MLFFGHGWKTHRFRAIAVFVMRTAFIPVLLLSTLLWPVESRAGSAVIPDQRTWMQVEETVIPIRENTSRNALVKGFARKGEVLVVEKSVENWVKVRVNDTLSGWAPATSLSPSGPPVHLNPAYVKAVLLALAGLGLGAFLFVAASLHLKRRKESRERTRQAMADAKRRLQNKIQLLFREEPRIHSHLVMDEVDLREFLQSIGYVANLESDPEKFLASCKAFKPNLIVAGFDFHDQVEKLAETDAMLINTPVIYLQCGEAPAPQGHRVRSYLETNASEKELSEAIGTCLRKSPEKIRYSVKPVALKGGIHAGTLMELLHFLSAVKKTGQLLAVSGTAIGEVILDKGDISKAAMKGLSGTKAVEAILNLSSGSFEFHENAKAAAAAEAGSLNTQKVLMDWAKSKDESNHHSRT